MAKATQSKKKTDAPKEQEMDLKTLLGIAGNHMPECVQKISSKRAAEFMQLLNEIGIGDMMHAVIESRSGSDLMLKPITAGEQVNASRKSRNMDGLEAKALEVKLHIDYTAITQAFMAPEVIERFGMIIMDCEAGEVNFAEVATYFHFFLNHFSAFYAALTSFMIRST